MSGQDFLRALRRIGRTPARLSRDGSLVITAPAPTTNLALDAATVATMVRQGLLERCGEGVRRSKHGEAFVRRALTEAADPSVANAPGETRTPEPAPQRNSGECPLTLLATRKGKDGRPVIDSVQLQAGQRLHADFERGHHRARVTQSWDASGVRGETPRDRLTVAEAAIAARKRVEAALAAVGPGLADALVTVCCEEFGLEVAEKRHNWPARSGKVVLAIALDRLAAHYGMRARPAEPSRVVHWGAADYKPRA